MSSPFSSRKTNHSSPSDKEHSCDSAGVSQAGCLLYDQGQMLGPELGLVEMSEAEYTHLQHLFQSHMETQAAPPDEPDVRSPSAPFLLKDAPGSTVVSPYGNTQAMDLSTSADDHSLVRPGEKTPASYGEVPHFVLAKVRGEDVLDEPHTNGGTPSPKRSGSSARVCLETRFDSMSSDAPRQQDIQCAALNNILTILQPQEVGLHPQMQKWINPDRTNSFEVTGSFVGGVFNPVTNMCEQVISHMPCMIDLKHQGLIIPQNWSFNFHPDRVVKTAHHTNGSSPAETQQSVNSENNVKTPAASRKHGGTRCPKPTKGAKTAPGGGTRKKSRARASPTTSKERHNIKERERRKKIRLCCDELNMLVPFCNSDSDKATTLHWTAAFLRYINKIYGDTLKEEFERTVRDEKGLSLKSCPSPSQDSMHREKDETFTIPLSVEQ